MKNVENVEILKKWKFFSIFIVTRNVDLEIMLILQMLKSTFAPNQLITNNV